MKIGDRFKIPEEFCGHLGRIVWVNEDSKCIGVKCNKPNYVDPFSKKPYGMTENLESRNPPLVPIKKRNTIYIIDVSDMK